MTSAGLVKIGIADPTGAATPILIDAGTVPFHAATVRVTLTRAVTWSAPPPGWPASPDETGAPAGKLQFSKTAPAGSVLNAFAHVAAALIAAGAAVKS